MSNPSPHEPVYRIGTVSRLTGIPAVTLRMWERRYSVVQPNRTEGRNRLYTRDDIGRLALIKRLVDDGNAISTVASLSLKQLQERIRLHSAPNQASPYRLAVVGTALPMRLDNRHHELQGLEVVGVFRDIKQLVEAMPELRPQIVVLEYPTIDDQTVNDIDRLVKRFELRRVVVIYGFGRRDVVKRLDNQTTSSLRAPIGLGDLRRACIDEPKGENPQRLHLKPETPPPEEIPPRRYSDESLARLAALPNSIHCECPQHLAELLFSLTAFETYSQECKNRHPDDAVLHAYLHVTTARARAMMETALFKVLEAEGIRE